MFSEFKFQPAGQKSKLGFEPRKMVRWFNPVELVRVGIKAFGATFFAGYADNREMQAALGELTDPSNFSNEDDLWFDYVADLGEGWNSTYAIAKLLAEPELKFNGHSDGLKRGRFLIMGGDEVYPVASREEYRNRTEAPYACALQKSAKPKNEPPELFALPGNHDWYDGLTSFFRQFCQRRSFGGLRTGQSRSYFAIKLPPPWWLWGVDMQLTADIDLPQREYFEQIAQMMKKDDRVILCVPEPTWVKSHFDAKAGENLKFLQKKILDENDGGRIVLYLAGDSHHYSRYEQASVPRVDGRQSKNAKEKRPAQLITAGGGGAFLHGTGHLPSSLNGGDFGAKGKFKLQEDTAYPTKSKSRRLVLWNLGFALWNVWFSLFLGGFSLFYSWLLLSNGMKLGLDRTDVMIGSWPTPEKFWKFMENMIGTWPTPDDIWLGIKSYVLVLAGSPSVALLTVLLFLGYFGFAYAGTSKIPGKLLKCLLAGSGHSLVYIVGIVALIRVFTPWVRGILAWPVDSLAAMLLTGICLLLVWVLWVAAGALVGGTIFGTYLLLSNLTMNMHWNDAYASLRIQGYKNFLRFHINRNKELEVYPIGVKSVPTKWKVTPASPPAWPSIEPEPEIKRHLLEKDLTLS